MESNKVGVSLQDWAQREGGKMQEFTQKLCESNHNLRIESDYVTINLYNSIDSSL